VAAPGALRLRKREAAVGGGAWSSRREWRGRLGSGTWTCRLACGC
jgi:hypothetical protein